jgi:hypothetical protein
MNTKGEIGKASVLKNSKNLNSPYLKGGLYRVTDFQEYIMKKKEKSGFTVEKSDKHCLNQVVKVNNNSDKSCREKA